MVGDGFDGCLSHCLAQKWAESSPFMWEPFLLRLEKAGVRSVGHDKDCFLKKKKILFLAFSWSSIH